MRRTICLFGARTMRCFVEEEVKSLRPPPPAEAIHLGSLIAAHGYIFPISDHVLTLKDDGTLYRFQVTQPHQGWANLSTGGP